MSNKFFEDEFSESDELPSESDLERQSRSIELSSQESEYDEEPSAAQEYYSEAQRTRDDDESPVQDQEIMNDLEIMSDARLRLEQGRLYELLMTHNIFDGVEADQRAINNVEQEMKAFIRDRLEIMLGIKQEKLKQEVVAFDEDEISILKGLVSKAKDSVLGSRQLPKAPVPTPAPQRTVMPPKPQVRQLKPNPVKISSHHPTMVKNVKVQPRQRPIVNVEAYEENNDKSVFEMSAEELIQRNKRISDRNINRKARATNAIPMPNASQEAMLYQTAEALKTNKNNDLSGTIFNILSANGDI